MKEKKWTSWIWNERQVVCDNIYHHSSFWDVEEKKRRTKFHSRFAGFLQRDLVLLYSLFKHCPLFATSFLYPHHSSAVRDHREIGVFIYIQALFFWLRRYTFFYKIVIFFRRLHVFIFKAKWSLQRS